MSIINIERLAPTSTETERFKVIVYFQTCGVHIGQGNIELFVYRHDLERLQEILTPLLKTDRNSQ